MSSQDITKAICKYSWSKFLWHKNEIVVPNVSHGFGLSYEADIIVCSRSWYLTEIEVKISKADFKADQFKDKHKLVLGDLNKIKYFYYAMPRDIWEKSQDVWRAPGAGVIVVDSMSRIEIVIPAEKKAARKLSPEQVLRLHKLCSTRYWDKI